MLARILVIAGSDSGGGAGIQADLKTAMALGAYAMTAITALTAQDTQGVHGVHPVPVDFIRLQIATALADPGADVVKTGMLGDAAVIGMVAEAIGSLPLVLDPVMVAKGGARLLPDSAVAAMVHDLLPKAAVITPNLPEAAALTGQPVADLDGMHRAADALLRMGAQAVLLKGGHLDSDAVVDILATEHGVQQFYNPRHATRHTHGTGCTLATAVAAGLGQGMSLSAAVERGIGYVQAAIAAAPGLGSGHGPLGHLVQPAQPGQQ